MVPADYQRLINPWQTRREIGRAVKFVDAVLRGRPEAERRDMLGLDRPPRDWAKPL